MAGRVGNGRLARQAVSHPERVVPFAFLVGIAAGTILLMLPLARAAPEDGMIGAPPVTALFTAASAFCVTGLATVNTATYWSPFGQVVILLLCQIGGFGIMTGATLLGMLVTGRNRLSGRLLAEAELKSLDFGDLVAIVRLVMIATLAVEGFLTILLMLRLHYGIGFEWGPSLWHGLFHAVGAFNNSGFTTLPQGLLPYSSDFWLLSPLMIGVLIGGIGFPVLFELSREWRKPRTWSVHTKLTLSGSAILLAAGFLFTLVAEWGNPTTLGDHGVGTRVLASAFHSVMARSGGFELFPVGAMRQQSLFFTEMLMLIGGGSASTAGGIKVTTFLILARVVWAEVRGLTDVTVFRRRIAPEVQRQAITVVLLAFACVCGGTLLLLCLTDLPLHRILFEVTSAFATVGLTASTTPFLTPPAQLVIVVLMYVGRVGTISVATAIALKVRRVAWRYPVERPIVG